MEENQQGDFTEVGKEALENFSSTSLLSSCFLNFVLSVINSLLIDPRFLKIHYNNFLVEYFIMQFPVQGYQFCRGFWENCRKFFPLLSSQKLLLGSLFLTVKTIRSSSNTFGFMIKN